VPGLASPADDGSRPSFGRRAPGLFVIAVL